VEHEVPEEQLGRIEQSVSEEIEAAVEFARSSPLPQPEEAFEDVFANDARSD
jgi:TPP-dependent pyruvate/acetoin dehydrogenase alpha subunit